MIKRLLFGTIPYHWTRIFSPDSELLHYYDYIRRHGYARHLFDFRHEYDGFEVCVRYDRDNTLYYVEEDGKRLYFKRGLAPEKIARLYKELVIEQDVRSAHHYFDNLPGELKGKVLLDVGGAEGLISLRAIEYVTHVYLFECDPLWIEALEATFRPWREKITFVNRLISSETKGNSLRLDDFLADKSRDHLFLKMDIEGFEPEALKGCPSLWKEGRDVHFAICTYHGNSFGRDVCTLLDSYGCRYTHQYGYFRKRIRSVVVRGEGSQACY